MRTASIAALMMDAVRTFETSVYIHDTSQHCVPERYRFHNHNNHDVLPLWQQ
jgi:hypothetical protein